MNKTSIEYLDYTWNPYSGCLNHQNGVCGGGGKEFNCWARTITKRFKGHYPFGFEPTFWPERLREPARVKKPSRIGICFMGDLFGDWKVARIPGRIANIIALSDVQARIQLAIEMCPQHTFLFLTKCPWNLPKWNPWPDNAWVGVSATNWATHEIALEHLNQVDAKVKFLSLEPLLQAIPSSALKGYERLQWVIIGGKSGSFPFYPPEEWIQEIETSCDRLGIPVFEKDNLRKVWYNKPRREYPNLEVLCHTKVKLGEDTKSE